MKAFKPIIISVLLWVHGKKNQKSWKLMGLLTWYTLWQGDPISNKEDIRTNISGYLLTGTHDTQT